MIKWIKQNRKFLNISAIEKHLNETCGMPIDTIRNALDDRQKLPQKWEEPINTFLMGLKNPQGKKNNDVLHKPQ